MTRFLTRERRRSRPVRSRCVSPRRTAVGALMVIGMSVLGPGQPLIAGAADTVGARSAGGSATALDSRPAAGLRRGVSGTRLAVPHLPTVTRKVPWSLGLPARLQYLGNARQEIVVTARSWRSTHGTLTAYVFRSGRWARVLGPFPARLGYHGLVPGTRRIQGSGTTPAGTYPIREAFGVSPDPGTALPYLHVTDPGWWWVEDRRSPYYNSLRRAGQGGFPRTEAGRNGSEQLLRHVPQYDFAVVIDFNRPNPVRGRGAGIFLHVDGPGATAGCVSVSEPVMVTLLRWLDPAAHPRITIAPASVLARY